jgi:hypothetical protein
MTDKSLGLVFWRVLDALDYWLTLTRLRILDALCGAELPTGMSRALLKFARQASLVEQAMRPWPAVQGRG